MRTYLYLTYNCNCNCFFCASDDVNVKTGLTELDFNSTKKFLLKNKNRHELIISGGEPTIHKDFLKIVQFAKMHYDRITLATNGIRFSDMEFLMSTLDAGVTKIGIPFYSTNEHKYNFLLSNKSAFQNILSALENINKLLPGRSFSVNIKLLIAAFSYKETSGIIDFISTRFDNLNRFSLNGFHISNKAFRHKEKSVINYQEAFPYINEAIDNLIEKKITFRVAELPFCAFSKKNLEYILQNNLLTVHKTEFLQRPDSEIYLCKPTNFMPPACDVCDLSFVCPKIYGKNAESFNHGVKPFILTETDSSTVYN